MFLEAVKAMRQALKANGVLNTGVDGQWYLDLAQEGFTYPYGVIADNASGMRHEAKNVDLADMRLLVKVVGTDQVATYELGELVRQTLNEADLTADSPWYAYRCQQIGMVALMEIEAEVAYFHAGGIYRLRMSS